MLATLYCQLPRAADRIAFFLFSDIVDSSIFCFFVFIKKKPIIRLLWWLSDTLERAPRSIRFRTCQKIRHRSRSQTIFRNQKRMYRYRLLPATGRRFLPCKLYPSACNGYVKRGTGTNRL